MTSSFRPNSFTQSLAEDGYLLALEQRITALEIQQEQDNNQTVEIPTSYTVPNLHFTDTLTDVNGDYIKSLQDLPQRVYDEVGAWDVQRTYAQSTSHIGQTLPVPSAIVDADHGVYFTDSFTLQLTEDDGVTPLVVPPGKYFIYAHIEANDMWRIKRLTCGIQWNRVSDAVETLRTPNFQFRPHTAGTDNPLWEMKSLGIPCTFFHATSEDEHISAVINTIVAPAKSAGITSTSRITFSIRVTRIATI